VGVLGVVEALASAVGAGFKYFDDKNAQKYLDKLVEVKSQLRAEMDKYPMIDSGRVEVLLGELKDVAEAYEKQVLVLIANRS
jgi:hypothetical protein